MSKIHDVIDVYLRHPIIIDASLLCTCLLINHYSADIITIKFSVDVQINLISNLIGTSVSLAGFILAALTIIVTFKSNISSRPIEITETPLELIFSSVHYHNIVRVFKDSIIELTFCFVALYLLWLNSASVNADFIYYSNVYGIIFISLSLFRSLLILFTVLSLDKTRESDKNGAT